jgi:hypothetical protein
VSECAPKDCWNGIGAGFIPPVVHQRRRVGYLSCLVVVAAAIRFAFALIVMLFVTLSVTSLSTMAAVIIGLTIVAAAALHSRLNGKPFMSHSRATISKSLSCRAFSAAQTVPWSLSAFALRPQGVAAGLGAPGGRFQSSRRPAPAPRRPAPRDAGAMAELRTMPATPAAGVSGRNCSIFSGWREQRQGCFYCCSRRVRIADCS